MNVESKRTVSFIPF